MSPLGGQSVNNADITKLTLQRRRFMTLLKWVGRSMAAGSACAAARADVARRAHGNRSKDPVRQALATALVHELGALDWHRYARELVALRPDAVLARTSPAVAALRQETKTIPVALITITDPVVRLENPATVCSPSRACRRANGAAYARQMRSSGYTKSSSGGSKPKPCCPRPTPPR
jgi:hypothetical protein